MNNSQKESLEEEEELRKNLAASQYRYSELKIERIIEYRDSITKNSGFNGKDK
jgi:thermostable 8-oxoguanine DNA glycosylase